MNTLILAVFLTTASNKPLKQPFIPPIVPKEIAMMGEEIREPQIVELKMI